ncbi:unnamed protein product [Lathyrus sativus]|nr:unnamed protein product [Lathyrus sativus]
MITVSDWIRSSLNQHINLYKQWFNLADSDGDGRVTENDATKFFALSTLSRPQLKQVWAIADTKRQGFLGFEEFVTAMQLISVGQAGYDLNSDILKTEIDSDKIKPPVLEGIDALVANTKSPAMNAQPDVFGTGQLQPFPRAASKSAKKLPLNAVTSIIDGLKKLYVERLKPLEATYRFNDFVSPLLTNSDFDAKPMVMLLGQYSTGKTTFIKHLLRCEYPGAHIGPEPTTDRFVAVMSGTDERSIPGNTVAVDASMPFSGLTSFGSSFLSKFQCTNTTPHNNLQHHDNKLAANTNPMPDNTCYYCSSPCTTTSLLLLPNKTHPPHQTTLRQYSLPPATLGCTNLQPVVKTKQTSNITQLNLHWWGDMKSHTFIPPLIKTCFSPQRFNQ